MKATCTLYHPDGVSGATRYQDGSTAYWTEGRDATIVLVRHNIPEYIPGEIWDMRVEADPELEAHTEEARDMTAEEAAEMNRWMGWPDEVDE